MSMYAQTKGGGGGGLYCGKTILSTLSIFIFFYIHFTRILK